MLRRSRAFATLASLLVSVIAGTAGAQELAPMRVDAPAPTVQVHIESPDRVQWISLTQSDNGAAQCETPCAFNTRPGRYWLAAGGDGLRATSLVVDLLRPDNRLRLRAPTSLGFGGGIAMTAVGSAAVVMISLMVAGALASAPGDPYNQLMAAIMGGTGGFVGVPLVIGGAVLIARHQPGLFDATYVVRP